MVIRLNSYILIKEVKNKMIHKLYDAQQTENETGFTLCSKLDNIIRPRGIPVGDSLNIKIDPDTHSAYGSLYNTAVDFWGDDDFIKEYEQSISEEISDE